LIIQGSRHYTTMTKIQFTFIKKELITLKKDFQLINEHKMWENFKIKKLIIEKNSKVLKELKTLLEWYIIKTTNCVSDWDKK
jgi:hypothetical protein